MFVIGRISGGGCGGGPVDTTAQVRAHFDVHLNRGCPSGFYRGLDSTKKLGAHRDHTMMLC